MLLSPNKKNRRLLIPCIGLIFNHLQSATEGAREGKTQKHFLTYINTSEITTKQILLFPLSQSPIKA